MKSFLPPFPIDHLLVVDFEATCCNKKTIDKKGVEIIEIGAVLVSWPQLEIVQNYQSYIQPMKHPILTSFCTKLTGIKQEDVDNAPFFPNMISDLQKQILQDRRVLFCCWSPFDWKQLNRDCLFHNIANPFPQHFWDLQALFRKTQRSPHNLSVAGAMKAVDLSFTGNQHSGFDDAVNTARLLPWCIPPKWRT